MIVCCCCQDSNHHHNPYSQCWYHQEEVVLEVNKDNHPWQYDQVAFMDNIDGKRSLLFSSPISHQSSLLRWTSYAPLDQTPLKSTSCTVWPGKRPIFNLTKTKTKTKTKDQDQEPKTDVFFQRGVGGVRGGPDQTSDHRSLWPTKEFHVLHYHVQVGCPQSILAQHKY